MRRSWLAVLVAAGLAIFVLSFFGEWIVHAREVRGEGFRFVRTAASAWREPGFPVLAVGVIVALVVALAGLARAIGRARVPGWVLVVGSALALGILASAAWPVAQDGHASSVDLSAGVMLIVGIGLAALMVGAAVATLAPARGVLAAASGVAVVAFALGAGGRWFGLQLAEGTGRHWSDGSYTRTATDGEPTETMTIGNERVTVGDRWAGSWEWSGWTVTIDNDPACPDARGTYHAHGEGEADLSFVMVVDPCLDGERAADLETGIWERD